MEKSDFFIAKAIGAGIVVFLILCVILGSFGIIQAGERGVKTRLGSVVGEVGTGLYFKLPFIEGVDKFSVKTLAVTWDKEDALAAATKDLQDVKISTVVNYHIDATKVTDIFSQYGDNYQSIVIEPIIRDTVKGVSAQYTAEELVTKRAEVSDKVTSVLSQRFAEKFAVVENVNITNLEFSASFSQAIEAKATAVQNAEAAKNKLEQVKFEAQQAIETAKGQAEAIKIQAEAINSQGGADYVQLQAIKAWKGEVPQYMMSGAVTPFINLSNK